MSNDLKSLLVYKFSCGSCSYIDKTCHHFKSKMEEHLKKDNDSDIFKYVHSTVTSFDSLSFKICNKGSSKFDLKIKEDLHIN